MNNDKLTFGIHLDALLTRAKMSQSQLASKSGLHIVTISRLINAGPEKPNPGQATVEKIAHAIPCALDDFLLLFRLAECIPSRIIEKFALDKEFARNCWRHSR